MPYIDEYRRKEFANPNYETHPKNAGELNYIISSVVANYLLERGVRYQTFNDVLGALEGVKQEIRSRFLDIYEAKKVRENGDLEIFEELTNQIITP